MVQLVRMLYMMNLPQRVTEPVAAAWVAGALLLEAAGTDYLLLEGGSDKLLFE